MAQLPWPERLYCVPPTPTLGPCQASGDMHTEACVGGLGACSGVLPAL